MGAIALIMFVVVISKGQFDPTSLILAASLLGLCDARVRLPLVEPMAETKTLVESAMRAAGVLN